MSTSDPFPSRRGPFAASRRAALTLLCGAVLAAGACSSPPSPTFDLTAPRGPIRGGPLSGQLNVAEPIALDPLSEQRILVREASGSVSFLAGAQWADRLPRLVQARLVQTFENSSRIRSVGRPGDGTNPDYLLQTELRAFQLDASAGQVVVEISAKVVTVANGRIGVARVFSSRVPVPSNQGPIVAQALDRALSNVLVDIVRWTSANR